MKLILMSLLMLICFQISALEVQVSELQQRPQMDHQFSLMTSLNKKVILDCQSFIQGLSIGEVPQQIFYMLEPYECEDLYGRINSSLLLLKKHCLDLDEIIRSDYTCH